MAHNLTPSGFACTADSRGRCADRHIEAELVEERDDRDLHELTCEDCGATGTVVVGSGLGNQGDILAVDGDIEAK